MRRSPYNVHPPLLGIALLAPALLLSPGKHPPPPVRPAHNLSGRPAVTQSPAVALPGRIAFIRDGDVSMLDLQSGVETQISDDGDDLAPAWSPDGRYQGIGFWSRKKPPLGPSAGKVASQTIVRAACSGVLGA